MKDTVKDFRVGQKTVGVSAVQIVAAELSDGNRKGILVKAYGSGDTAANTVPVFVGNAQVTLTDGFPLAPGESIMFPIEDAGDLYAIASAADQKLAWALV
jgi:hypothetical protein